jgi:hypothetical protein
MARLLIVSRSMALAMRLADQHEVTEHPADDIDGLLPDIDADVLVLDVGDAVLAVNTVNALREADQDIPVLLVSGYQPEWEQVEAQRVEGVHVVPLPITRAALLVGIAELVGEEAPPLTPSAGIQPSPDGAAHDIGRDVLPGPAGPIVGVPPEPYTGSIPRPIPQSIPQDGTGTGAPVMSVAPTPTRADDEPPAPLGSAVPEATPTEIPAPASTPASVSAPASPSSPTAEAPEAIPASAPTPPPPPAAEVPSTAPPSAPVLPSPAAPLGSGPVAPGGASTPTGPSTLTGPSHPSAPSAPGSASTPAGPSTPTGLSNPPSPSTPAGLSTPPGADLVAPPPSADGAPGAPDAPSTTAAVPENPYDTGETGPAAPNGNGFGGPHPAAPPVPAADPVPEPDPRRPFAPSRWLRGAGPAASGEAHQPSDEGRRLPRLGHRPRKLQRPPEAGDPMAATASGVSTPVLTPPGLGVSLGHSDLHHDDSQNGDPQNDLHPNGLNPDDLGHDDLGRSDLDRRLDAEAAELLIRPGRPGAVLRTADLVRQLADRAGDLYGVNDTAQVLADDVIERADADAVAVLVPDGPVWRVSGGVGLRPLERRLQLDETHWLIAEIGAAGRAVLVEDTDIIRQDLAGAPLAAWRHLLAVPVPGVRAIVILARGDEGDAFTDRDLTAVISPVREAAALLLSAVETRRLARLLGPLREQDNDGLADRPRRPH